MKTAALLLALILPLQGCALMVVSNTGWPGGLAGEILGYSDFEIFAAGILTDEVAGSIATGIKARKASSQRAYLADQDANAQSIRGQSLMLTYPLGPLE